MVVIDAQKGPIMPACRSETAKRRQAKMAPKVVRMDARSGRLPDGAVYHTTSRAATESWTVTLAIPGFPMLATTASGSVTVERALDRMYRERLPAATAAASADGDTGCFPRLVRD